MKNKFTTKSSIITAILFSLQISSYGLSATQITCNEIIAHYDAIDSTITKILIELTATQKQVRSEEIIRSQEQSSVMTFNFKDIKVEDIENTRLNGKVEIIALTESDRQKYNIIGEFTLSGIPFLSEILFHADNENYSYIEINKLNRTFELSDYFKIQSHKYIHILKELFNQ